MDSVLLENQIGRQRCDLEIDSRIITVESQRRWEIAGAIPLASGVRQANERDRMLRGLFEIRTSWMRQDIVSRMATE
jgi:hypothetical protein